MYLYMSNGRYGQYYFSQFESIKRQLIKRCTCQHGYEHVIRLLLSVPLSARRLLANSHSKQSRTVSVNYPIIPIPMPIGLNYVWQVCHPTFKKSAFKRTSVSPNYNLWLSGFCTCTTDYTVFCLSTTKRAFPSSVILKTWLSEWVNDKQPYNRTTV